MKDNIKNQISKIKNTVQRSKILKFVFFLVFFVFLTFNLISSQSVSSIYFQIVNNNKQVTVNFLEKIKTFPEFPKILEMNKKIYGKTIEEEVFRQENDKNLMINNFEQKLKINPKARDVLYSLYLLYKEKGDSLTAENYLKQAKEIDPDVISSNNQ